ncbi:MAG: 23S rRNA (guanosine(2251)-2'-O)-methyltransferase RlmB [Ignavibacteriae bacterium]|nr:23S rRNA (guanosine(2251)-2'-O)-methyltransferase RlmB [Ignavibacteriota bacterium]MCB9243109.1 23S rRNA (guanosine(2251)-2'-O)-methyltransferase RlmB [Ignavibacteriales bacterium]
MIVIGKNPVYEILVTTPKELNKIVLLKTLKPEPKLKKIVKLAEENGINLMMLNRFGFEKFFNRNNKKEGISQGVIGFIKDFEYTPLKEIIDGIKDHGIINPVIVLMDEITDPHNMGAIIRSAVCLGADGIVIPRHNSAEVNHTVFKSSSGAVNHIQIAKETNLAHSIEYLKKNGYWIAGTDLKADKTIFETDLKMPLGLVIGSEGTGMRDLIRKNCDLLLRIPMAGKLDSLNASVSAGVFLYEIFRQKNM